jgi:hypothetical protein
MERAAVDAGVGVSLDDHRLLGVIDARALHWGNRQEFVGGVGDNLKQVPGKELKE